MRYRAGDIVIAPFSHTDLTEDKNRPLLLVRHLPSSFNDWLGVMITSQRHQFIEGVDILLGDTESDFPQTSLRTTSVIRTTRVMVISEDVISGKIGSISKLRLENVTANLINWLSDTI